MYNTNPCENVEVEWNRSNEMCAPFELRLCGIELNADQCIIAKTLDQERQQLLKTHRLSVSPTAIGRTPSGSFTSAIRFAPHKYLATDSCPPPPKRVFTRDVIRCKNDPDKSDVSKSCKCSGRSPRQPDADVEGNEKMTALTRLQSTN
ncbi:hypothetical protein GJ496_008486 [Pomphorhynchus laevis]|nr:hypothetical protein GJ496_008486 [Pomphorhynchus laevis]